jgi:serine phosphatase RsbU (regulator of sigma subunit)
MINVGSVSVVVILLTLYYKFVANQISQKLVGANQTLTEQSNKLETFNEELSQQAEELQIQSEQLAHSNRYTTNSIRYALRIQEAVLPSEYALENLFGEKNTMIFYSPKDIVSGDFYWCRETAEGEKILVVADCTGHGVPGAMLMMVGESILSNIVLEKNITEPALILDALQVYFSTLFTSTHNIQDGMDVSISKMNYETKKLYFAGARNPITYIQNQQMKTIQGDKMSIGDSKFKSKIGNKFTPHQIDISIPTMIYMYTDGYQDQFGGKKDKKFYSKNLRNLFFDIHQKPVPEQRKHLKKTFVEWCDITQQTDDVTIVGIKIDTNHKPNAVQELESERIIRKIIEAGK